MFLNTDFNLFFWYAAVLGIGATLFMDLYTFALKRIFHVQSLDYALVGRWILHFNCQFLHSNITQSLKKRYEGIVGWASHYVIGAAFGAMFLFLSEYFNVGVQSFVGSAVFGLVTVTLPFFIMQPCFGFGIAASNTPSPFTNRLKSVAAHAMYGTGIYVSALLLPYIHIEI
ncbi:DUF2938 family protein [Pseudoalteromonas luteoviolacea]|uniref:DUF2938 domain-containing protein n=1 Tax=Pseudoalteromonas luteoviolacea S4060-1 TaxID=1365257 RepID=A0A167P067_9GAMM|nr:DUF2938 family protein [Pseudoalteromonas luteoviolacea]KZN69225.1 hypothetical protein N478_11370 [Pseudoalteromonas luteoviolacea S4060-1]